VLCEPDGETVRYVGKTVDPKERYHYHTNASVLRHERTHKANWIKSLIAKGEKPVMKIIETISFDGDWEEAERRWIVFYREQGARLTNLTDGGDGQAPGYRPSEETRRKMSESHRGRKMPEAERAKRRGKKHTDEAKLRMSEIKKAWWVCRRREKQREAGENVA
jgi:hypothetical protein